VYRVGHQKNIAPNLILVLESVMVVVCVGLSLCVCVVPILSLVLESVMIILQGPRHTTRSFVSYLPQPVSSLGFEGGANLGLTLARIGFNRVPAEHCSNLRGGVAIMFMIAGILSWGMMVFQGSVPLRF
jgi:hypothetical protein